LTNSETGINPGLSKRSKRTKRQESLTILVSFHRFRESGYSRLKVVFRREEKVNTNSETGRMEASLRLMPPFSPKGNQASLRIMPPFSPKERRSLSAPHASLSSLRRRRHLSAPHASLSSLKEETPLCASCLPLPS